VNAGGGGWATPANLAAGARTFRADASDSANRITSASLPLTIAGKAAAALPALAKPAITGPAAGGTFVAGQQVNFAGTATPGSTVRLIAADGRAPGTTVPNAEGKWNLALPPPVAPRGVPGHRVVPGFYLPRPSGWNLDVGGDGGGAQRVVRAAKGSSHVSPCQGVRCTQRFPRRSGGRRSRCPTSVSTSRPSTSTCTAVMSGMLVVMAFTMV